MTHPTTQAAVERARSILTEMTEKSPFTLYMGTYTTREANEAIRTLLSAQEARADQIEAVLIKRIVAGRLDGYTLETSKEIAALSATPPAAPSLLAGPELYRPGVFRCAKCGLRSIHATFSAANGTISPRQKTDTCPNGCGPLWPVTWKAECLEAEKLEDEAVEAIMAKRELVRTATDVFHGIVPDGRDASSMLSALGTALAPFADRVSPAVAEQTEGEG